MKKVLFFILAVYLVLNYSCTKDYEGIDPDIMEVFEQNGLTFSDFMLPRRGSYGELPQSTWNIVTEDKIRLGASIFWDPVWLQNPLIRDENGIPIPGREFSISCGSCHIKDGHAGVSQGLGEGGDGTGLDGIARRNGVPPELIDGQGRRPPNNMHVAFKPNALWDGPLGSPDLSLFINSEGMVNRNEGLVIPNERVHELNTLFRGFGGAEMQGIMGLTVHRMAFSEEIVANAGSMYRTLFERVFRDNQETSLYRMVEQIPPSAIKNKYIYNNTHFIDFDVRKVINGEVVETLDTVPLHLSKLAAAMAIAAYNRHLVADDAPFQRYLRGERNAMTPQQKRGLVQFVERRCINCHNGPALTDADFHVMGSKDLDTDITGNPIAGFATSDQRGVDLGRFNVTGNPEHLRAFLTPTLYNLPRHAFHGGVDGGDTDGGTRFAMEYMLNRQPANQAIPVSSDRLDPRWLDNSDATPQQREDLFAFLNEALRDPNFNRKYRPGVPGGRLDPIFSRDNTAGTNGVKVEICSPNNDIVSRQNRIPGVNNITINELICND
jgi:cytochrome c peroxidase